MSEELWRDAVDAPFKTWLLVKIRIGRIGAEKESIAVMWRSDFGYWYPAWGVRDHVREINVLGWMPLQVEFPWPWPGGEK